MSKPISRGQPSRPVTIRLTAAQADKLRALGGGAWVRQQLEGGATGAARSVLAERFRQVSAEGWTPEHDDAHADRSLALAAACYALVAAGYHPDAVRETWPKSWASSWLKPKGSRRDLERAGALILAELERLERTAIRNLPDEE